MSFFAEIYCVANLLSTYDFAEKKYLNSSSAVSFLYLALLISLYNRISATVYVIVYNKAFFSWKREMALSIHVYPIL